MFMKPMFLRENPYLPPDPKSEYLSHTSPGGVSTKCVGKFLKPAPPIRLENELFLGAQN